MDTVMLKLARQMKERPLSANERYWLEVIRLASHDADPGPSLALTQALRILFQRGVAGNSKCILGSEDTSGGQSLE